jgi:hypothetical protein
VPCHCDKCLLSGIALFIVCCLFFACFFVMDWDYLYVDWFSLFVDYVSLVVM